MSAKKIIVATIAGGLLYAAWRFYKKQAKLLEEYTIKPIGAKFLKLSLDVATIEFTVRITNKSAIEATVIQMYSDVYLNGQLVGFINNSGKALIPGNGTSDIKMILTITPKEILKNIVASIGSSVQSRDILYRMKGYAKIKSSFLTVSVPFDYNGSLKKDFLFSNIPIIK